MACTYWKQLSVLRKALYVLTGIAFVAIIAGITVVCLNITSKRDSTSSNSTEPIQTVEFASFISPCENFWKFACGNANGRKNWNLSIEEQVMREKIQLFSGDSPPNEPQSLTKMKNFYKACVKQGSVTEINWEKLKNILKEVGGWPAVEGESRKDYNWGVVWTRLKQCHSTDWCAHICVDGEAPLDFDRLADIAETLGGNRTDAEKQFQETIHLKNTICNDTSPEGNFEKLRTYARKEKLYNKRALNFVLMHVISELNSLSNNSTKQQEKCFHFVSSKFPTFDKIIYARQYYNKNSTNDLNKFIEKMKISLKNEFNKLNTNLEDVDKQKILSEITNYSYSMNYSDKFFDDDQLGNDYENLLMSDDDFLEGVSNYMQYTLKKPRSATEPSKDELNVELAEKFLWLQTHMPDFITHRSFVPIVGMEFITEFVKNYTAKCPLSKNPNDECLMPYVIQNIQNLSYIHQDYDDCQSGHWAVQAAYSLHNEWPNNNENEPPLAIFANYTKEQMFWINYAHTKCEKIDKSSRESADTLLLLNVLRSKDFHRDFQCNDFFKKSNCTIN